MLTPYIVDPVDAISALSPESGFPRVPDEGVELVASVDPEEFVLLERAIELVVQSGVFSRVGLQAALRLENDAADELANELETLGVIEDDTVLIEVQDLSFFLIDVRASRHLAA